MTCPEPKSCDWQTNDRLVHQCERCGLVDHQATRFLRAWAEKIKRRKGIR